MSWLEKDDELSNVIKLMNDLLVLLLLLFYMYFVQHLRVNSIIQLAQVLVLNALFHGDRHSGKPVLKTKQAIFICSFSPQSSQNI